MATNYLDTGDTGRAVSSESDGALFAGIFGAEKYVLENGSQLKAEVQSNNIVKISDGDAVMYGRHVRIQANDSALVTINNGHSGTNRIDLIVFRYTKDSTGKETVDLVVIQGEDSTRTPTAPTAVNGNILTGAMKSDFPLYSVELNGINIVKVNPLFNVIGNISKLKEELTELNGKSIVDFGSNYMKYGNGLLIQWGTARFPGEASGGKGFATINFQKTFANTSYTLIACAKYPGTAIPAFLISTNVNSVSKAYVYARTTSMSAVTGAECSWLAIGQWK